MGGAFIDFGSGNPSAAAENATYITRQAADKDSLFFHNEPENIRSPHDHTTRAGWQDQRMRLRTWAQMRQEEEISRHGNRAGNPRTHYRTVLSFEEKISSERAVGAAQEWLEKEFPDARAFAVVHQDTDNTHVHVWMSARKTDGSKINVSASDFRSLTSEWDRIYSETMERRGKLKKKMEETREFKREYARRRAAGASKEELKRWAQENRPYRSSPPPPRVYRKRDDRAAGKIVAEDAKESLDKIVEKDKKDIESVINTAKNTIKEDERKQRRSKTTESRAGRNSKKSRSGNQQTGRSGNRRDRARRGEDQDRSEEREQHSKNRTKETEKSNRGGANSDRKNSLDRGNGGGGGGVDRHDGRGSSSVGGEGRNSPEVDNDNGRSDRVSASDTSPADGAGEAPMKQNIRSTLENEDMLNSTAAERARELSDEEYMDLVRTLSKEERNALIDAELWLQRRDASREASSIHPTRGWSRLSGQEKESARSLQMIAYPRDEIAFDEADVIDSVNDTISEADDISGRAESIKAALPHGAPRKALNKAFREAKSAAEEENKEEDRSRERGRGGGRGR
jgi:hypothetical protein